jgi:Right handed beta helix region
MPRAYLITFLLAILGAVATNQAQAAPRTFVASFGADTNTASNCSVALPCRGFAAAQTVTDNGGEIVALDSAGYGAINIYKSISIISPTGVYAGISASSGSNGYGVIIDTAGINVVLRGLTINGRGGNRGINMTAGNKLTVENCVISNSAESGISVNGGSILRVTDSTIRDHGAHGIWLQNGTRATITRATVIGNGNTGIRAEGSTSTTTTVDIADSTISGNANGVFASQSGNSFSSSVKVSIRDSNVVRNSNAALLANGFGSASTALLTASNNIISNNNNAIQIAGQASAWATGNTVSDNESVFTSVNGGLVSAGNNAVRNNRFDTSDNVTIIPTK